MKQEQMCYWNTDILLSWKCSPWWRTREQRSESIVIFQNSVCSSSKDHIQIVISAKLSMYPSWCFMLDTLCSRDTAKKIEEKNPSAHSCSKFLAIAFTTIFSLIWFSLITAQQVDPSLQLWHFCFGSQLPYSQDLLGCTTWFLTYICISSPWEKRHWQNGKMWNVYTLFTRKKRCLVIHMNSLKQILLSWYVSDIWWLKIQRKKKKICCRITKWPQ